MKICKEVQGAAQMLNIHKYNFLSFLHVFIFAYFIEIFSFTSNNKNIIPF